MRHFIIVTVDDLQLGRRHRQTDGAGELIGGRWIGGCGRRGFGQTIAFANRTTGHFAPFIVDDFLHRHAAAVT
ncbi:hypothetical protein D3C81_1650410 [compost metagenome]